MKPSQHYKSLDGLRGVAALSVVLLHYCYAFAPFLIGVLPTSRHTSLDHIISVTPLHLPVAGGFAVCIFFVLSGFVLSLSFFKYNDRSLLTLGASKRYFRLMVPAFGSIMLGYLLLRFGLFYSQEAAVGSESSGWLGIFWNFPADLWQAILQGLYGIWFNGYTSYNPVLWTMHFELFGSFLVFLFLGLFGSLRNRWIFYVAFGLVFIKTYYLGFLLGMAICDTVINWPGIFKNLKERWLWMLLPLGLILGAWRTTSIYPTVYNHVSLPLFTTLELELFMQTIGATILVIVVLKLRYLSKLLSTRPLQFLGKISFALYLIHFLILCSFASYIFAKTLPIYGYGLAFCATVAIAIPVTIGASYIYTRYVDIPAIKFSKAAGGALTGNSSLSLRQLKYSGFFKHVYSKVRSK